MTGEPFVGCHEWGGDKPLPYGIHGYRLCGYKLARMGGL